HHPGEGPSGQLGLRYRPSKLRHEQLLQQPGAGPDPAVAGWQKHGEKSLPAPEGTRRRRGPAALGPAWREPDQALAETGVVHRREGGWAVQAGGVPVLRRVIVPTPKRIPSSVQSPVTACPLVFSFQRPSHHGIVLWISK